MQNQIHQLESTCTDLTTKIADLDEKARKKAEEADYYREKIEATLEGARRRGSITSVPRNCDAAFAKTDELICETENLRHKAAALANLLLSCIRTTYENCRVQEMMLRHNRSELYRNNQKLKTALETTNEKARMVLEHLGNAEESNTIEWASILVDEADQRHVLGNLQNRLQMGQFSLEKCIEKIHKAHGTEMRKYQDDHQKQLVKQTSRIWELEKSFTEAISVNRSYEKKNIKLRERHDSLVPMIDSIRRSLRKLRKDCHDNNNTTSQLREDYYKLRNVTERLLNKLRTCKDQIQSLEAAVVEKQEDVNARDTAMEQLEKLLEKITHKYAENERLRVKVTHEVAIQAVPVVADVASHADFLPSNLKGVPAASEDNKPSDALLPGRIFLVRDENWPSRINLGSCLQYRRAIDKL